MNQILSTRWVALMLALTALLVLASLLITTLARTTLAAGERAGAVPVALKDFAFGQPLTVESCSFTGNSAPWVRGPAPPARTDSPSSPPPGRSRSNEGPAEQDHALRRDTERLGTRLDGPTVELAVVP